jgi:hypothetical protein
MMDHSPTPILVEEQVQIINNDEQLDLSPSLTHPEENPDIQQQTFIKPPSSVLSVLTGIKNPSLKHLTSREKRPYSFSMHDAKSTLVPLVLPLNPTLHGSNANNPHSRVLSSNTIIISKNNNNNTFSSHFPNNETEPQQVQRLQKMQKQQYSQPVGQFPVSKPRPPNYPVREQNVVKQQQQPNFYNRSNDNSSSSVVSLPTLPLNNSNIIKEGRNRKYENGNTNSLAGKYTKIPRIYQRQNMAQWVAKKVWFYMNGDDRFPRIEYRFRPRDLQTMDHLLNLLNLKMPQLPKGARYVFTLDGRLISSVDELQNEQGYVVSSVKKFKVR